MVAYSFNKQFVDAIQSGQKLQTIRAHRRRHARVGEQLQLYTGIRTKACRLIRNDVRCTRIDEIRFDLSSMADITHGPKNYAELRDMIDSRSFEIAINGMPIDPGLHDFFAFADGFTRAFWDRQEDQPLTPFDMMVMFWMGSHGAAVFNGVRIGWEPIS